MVVNNRAKAAILKQLRGDGYDAFPPPSKKQESATENADLEDDVRAQNIDKWESFSRIDSVIFSDHNKFRWLTRAAMRAITTISCP
jgi:hypothetical protein